MPDRFVSDPGGLTSLTLLERAKQSEPVAWQQLVELYAPIVYLRCRNQWGLSPSDSEQVGQEVFTAIAKNLGQFEPHRTGSFRTWLRTIVDNKCKDEFRNRQVAIAVGGTQARQALENVTDLRNQPDDSGSDQDEKSVLLNQAMKLIENEFSTRDWEIFWRVAVDEMNRQSVAEEFGVSDNVIYLAYSRIRKRLKVAFQDLLDDELLAEWENKSP